MAYRLSTPERRVAEVTLGQISDICDNADSLVYKPHPLLKTRDSSCIVDMRLVSLAQPQAKIEFDFRAKNGTHITKAKVGLLTSGQVDIKTTPITTNTVDEIRQQIHYMQEYILPPPLMKAILDEPSREHELSTNILAAESLQYFIHTSHVNRHTPLATSSRTAPMARR